MKHAAFLVSVLLASGCMAAPTGPGEGAPPESAPAPVSPAATASPPGAPENGTATPLHVESFEGPLESLPTFGEWCTPDPFNTRHAFAVPRGTTHARLEIVPDADHLEARARVHVDGAQVAEGRKGGAPLVLDLAPDALAGGQEIEILLWFCGFQFTDHVYLGALSFFDEPVPAGYRAAVTGASLASSTRHVPPSRRHSARARTTSMRWR